MVNLRKWANRLVWAFAFYWMGLFILTAMFQDMMADIVALSAALGLYVSIFIPLFTLVAYAKAAQSDVRTFKPTKPKVPKVDLRAQGGEKVDGNN